MLVSSDRKFADEFRESAASRLEKCVHLKGAGGIEWQESGPGSDRFNGPDRLRRFVTRKVVYANPVSLYGCFQRRHFLKHQGLTGNCLIRPSVSILKRIRICQQILQQAVLLSLTKAQQVVKQDLNAVVGDVLAILSSTSARRRFEVILSATERLLPISLTPFRSSPDSVHRLNIAQYRFELG